MLKTIYDPITGKLMQVPKSTQFDVVDTFTDLPDPTTRVNETIQVKTSQGIWPFTLRPAGLYYSDGVTWIRLGLTASEIQTQINAHSSRTDNPHLVTPEQISAVREEYETISKNLRSWDAAFNYTSGDLTSIVYTQGTETITKTFNYTTGTLTSIVLSGDTPTGINLTKTFTYTSGNLTGITFS